METNHLFELCIEFHSSLISRDFIIDYFVDSDYSTEEEASRSKTIRPGKLIQRDDKLFVVTAAKSLKEIETVREIPFPKKKLSFYHRFQLKKGMIENFNEDTPVETTLGVYILNYIVLVKPFDTIIPYINGYWKLSKIEPIIAKLSIEGVIQPRQIYDYINYAYFLSSLNDFCVPSITAKSITSNPEVNKLRDELFEEYKDQLDDPNVMVMIEDKVIALDKKLLANDPSSGFMIKSKNFDVQRKRMFLMLGLVDTFGDDVQGYEFGKFNLNEGWDLKEMAIIANDVRRGSNSRAKLTALGGYESKVLGRNFQDSVITMDDCGTTSGLSIKLTIDNISLFYYRNMLYFDGKEYIDIELNSDNASSYIGKDVVIRSPQECLNQQGYCYACMDTRFKIMDIKQLNIYPINIGSTFVSLSLKKVHGTKVDVFEIDDLNKILF